MSDSLLTDSLIGAVVIVWFASRQLSWRVLDPARMWRLPIILAIAGVLSLAKAGASPGPVDVTIIAISVIVSLGSGIAMGRLARFRPSAQRPGLVETRAGWPGVALWVLLIAVRVLLGVIGHEAGSVLAESTGMILVVVALNRIASGLVMSARMSRRPAGVAGR